MAHTGEYDSITFDKSITIATGGLVKSRLRPDLIGKRKDGKYDIIEVRSPGQSKKKLRKKMKKIKALFRKRGLLGTGRVEEIW